MKRKNLGFENNLNDWLVKKSGKIIHEQILPVLLVVFELYDYDER
jgi:hypothetical protein